MKSRLPCACLSLLLCTAAVARAEGQDGPLMLSVEEAALQALEHNRDLNIQRLLPEVQGAFAQIARGDYDTELFAETSLGTGKSEETSRVTGERFEVEASSSDSVVGARQRFATGTEVELSLRHEYGDSSRTPTQHSSRLGLGLTQSLLKGLGPSVNLAAIEQADLGIEASRHELRAYAQAVLAQAEIAYWRYVLAIREIVIFEQSLELARRQRSEIEQEIEVGTRAETESAAACAEVALREQNLIDACSLVARQRLLLLHMLGLRLEREVQASSDPAIEPRALTDLDDRLRLAERSRAELAEAALRLEQRELEVVVTRNGLMPRLDFFIHLSKTGFASDFAGAFGHLGDDTFEVLGGLSFSWLVQNRASEGAQRQAVASRRQAELAIANLREQVRLEVRLAYAEAERARLQIGASAATLKLQEEKVAVEQERFRVGESTALLLAQAQRDLLQARIAEVEALVDYRCALVQLYQAEGSLLDRRGLRLD